MIFLQISSYLSISDRMVGKGSDPLPSSLVSQAPLLIPLGCRTQNKPVAQQHLFSILKKGPHKLHNGWLRLLLFS